MEYSTDIVIIGAGITGLTTAFYLDRAKQDFLVIDNRDYPGGVIRTVKCGEFVYETGPNTGVLGSLEAVKLFEQLHGEKSLTADYALEKASTAAKKRFIVKGGKPVIMPMGIGKGISTRLFTFKDKLRVLFEPFRKRGTNPDETLAEFVKRRLGQSILDYAINPFISGVYAGDPGMLVTKYAFPKLYNLEQNYGSLIGGSVKIGKVKKKEKEQNPDLKKVTRETFSAGNGLSNLAYGLYNRIGEGRFILSAQKAVVSKTDGGYEVSFVRNGERNTIKCRRVVNTAGAYAFPELFPFVDSEDKKLISNVVYSGVVECAVGFEKWEGTPLDGFGCLVPQKENRKILGALYMSTLFKNRAPKDGALLAVFMGGIRHLDYLDLPDTEIKEMAAEELSSIFDIKDFAPDMFKVMRHSKAIPQYQADTKQRMEVIEKIETQFPGLFVGGNMIGGIGMSDRIKQGVALAEKCVNNS
ncbi:MAG: protoporphyrinogen oxidase [Bacteroidales bacterium]|nr:protoporphyrinogen oxidase [Bacteroidales bacterium]